MILLCTFIHRLALSSITFHNHGISRKIYRDPCPSGALRITLLVTPFPLHTLHIKEEDPESLPGGHILEFGCLRNLRKTFTQPST